MWLLPKWKVPGIVVAAAKAGWHLEQSNSVWHWEDQGCAAVM